MWRSHPLRTQLRWHGGKPVNFFRQECQKKCPRIAKKHGRSDAHKNCALARFATRARSILRVFDLDLAGFGFLRLRQDHRQNAILVDGFNVICLNRSVQDD